jgi:DDE superfamily endonuclease
MPTWIIQHFDPLCQYLLPLIALMGAPQQRHALNVVGALMVCGQKHKVLTALTAILRVPHADHFALADFFRQSEWCPKQVRQAVLASELATLGRAMEASGNMPVFLSVDDSLACKDVGTSALEAVTFHHDHVKQRRQSQEYTNAARYVTVSAQVNCVSFPLNWRLYLSKKQVKKLNPTRDGDHKLKYVKLITLVIEMLDEIQSNWLALKLPPAARVYVLFDSWYASAELLNNVRQRSSPQSHWHFICALKSNRTLSGSSVSDGWRMLSRQRIKRVTLHNTKGSHTYHTRCTTGRLRGFPQPVVAVFSKRNPRKKQTAFFISSDLHLRAQGILRFYAFRWQAETDNFLLKERLGLADFRLHSVEAALRWFSLVFAAYAFIRVRIAETWLIRPNQPVQSFHDVIAEQQHWHLEQLIAFVADRAREGWSNQKLITHLFPT